MEQLPPTWEELLGKKLAKIKNERSSWFLAED
jgi:hypothetical protein